MSVLSALVARSAPECRLYIELHPCSCGEAVFDVRHRLITGPGDSLRAVYEGTCRRCGLPRRFEFTLDPATPPPPPAFGGPTPSQIICPGQFALVADEAARSAAPDPAGLDQRERARSRATLARAVAAQEEVLKFIPAGADAVPADAFTSPPGRAFYAREPGRFDRRRLEAVAQAYREALRAYDGGQAVPQVSPQPREVEAIPLARTPQEAHLYMDLHPCQSCGEAKFGRDSTVLAGASGMLRRYAGACGRCGAAREFRFRLPATPPPAPPPGRTSFGGDEPSELLDAGEWLRVADAYARLHPADPSQIRPAELPRARADLAFALAAMDEVAKFVPAGADAVPESAVWSEIGRQRYAGEPHRFRSRSINAVRDAYRDLLGRLP